MALVESQMVLLGSAMPEFDVPDVDGKRVCNADLAAMPVLVAFMSNHCPYVQFIERGFGDLVRRTSGIHVIAVASNDVANYPQDGPEHMADQAARAGWSFPYVLDDSQEMARSFGATCTPDFFLYDTAHRLVYRGAMDEASPGNGKPVTGELLEQAIELVTAGKAVPEPHRPSRGCSIKWRD